MGLDLRAARDSVRRYLPLSVIWVTTTRLKRLVGLLTRSGRDLTTPQEQIDEALGELRAAIEGVGQISGAMTALGGAPDPASARRSRSSPGRRHRPRHRRAAR